jgi:hypothetical protein
MTNKPTPEQKKRSKEFLDAARMIGKAHADSDAEELLDRLAKDASQERDGGR